MEIDKRRVTRHVESVVARLEKLVKEYTETGKSRLPTVSHLARSMGLSAGTLCKALNVLRQQGVVSLSQRAGITINNQAVGSAFDIRAARTGSGSPASINQKETIIGRLLHDMLVGEFSRDGMLPTAKELSARYGTTFKTLKKSTRSLVSEGLLIRYKKRYRTAAPVLQNGRARLVVIAFTESIGVLAQNTPRSAEFWRLLERESVRRGLSLDIWDFNRARKNLAVTKSGSGPDKNREDIIGYLVLTHETNFEDLHEVFGRLDKTARPVAVVDEIGKVIIPSIVSTSPRMRLFVMSSTMTAGKIMGSYLLSLGHRTIGYFGTFINGTWSRNRWQGLTDAYARAGINNGVVQFAQDRVDDWDEIYGSTAGMQPFDIVESDLSKVRQLFNPDTRRDKRAFYLYVLPFLWNLKLESIMNPVFDNALKDKNLTAWVAENDFVAILALEFLKRHQVRVPGDISVVGFDDTIEGLGMGLTSFDFNVPALVHAALNHVVSVTSFRKLLNKGPMEIPGILMERKSTGPARK